MKDDVSIAGRADAYVGARRALHRDKELSCCRCWPTMRKGASSLRAAAQEEVRRG